jgi:1,4-alpha-glucan branching enzyme
MKALKTQKVRLEFHDAKAQAVFISGTFNDWNPTSTPMIPLGEGRWAKELTLPPGRYEYRFVVDGEWISDPVVPEQAPNPHGSFNSVLEVGTQR